MHLKGLMIFELQFPRREWVQPASSFRVRAGTEGLIRFSKVFGYFNTHKKHLRCVGLSSAYAGNRNLSRMYTRWDFERHLECQLIWTYSSKHYSTFFLPIVSCERLSVPKLPKIDPPKPNRQHTQTEKWQGCGQQG